LWAFLCLTLGENLNVTGDGWAYFCYGNCLNDKQTKTTGGTVLMGGGSDVDDAYRWMIKNSGGGDLLVLRANYLSDAYNEYIYELGTVNTVSTIVMTRSGKPSSDPFVLEKIKNCEGLYFAGGDQWIYYSWWKGTPIQKAVQALIDANVTVGGTSAGMAIMAEFPFTAEFDTVTSAEALRNPYLKQVTLGIDFLTLPYLSRSITDMHFIERDRMGRTLTFIAREMQDRMVLAWAVACDQATAILVSEDGIGTVVIQPGGRKRQGPTQKAYVFVPTQSPTRCTAGEPLSFTGITVHRLEKGQTFDFKTMSSSQAVVYTVDVVDGHLSSKGNNGHIY